MGRTSEHEIRVRYGETDQMGVVHHATYLIYMEEGRTRLMEDLGEPYHELEARGWALVVRKADLRFRSFTCYGDVVVVKTWVKSIRGASVVFAYELRHRDEGRLLAEGTTELACLDVRGEKRRPAPLPEDVRSLLES